MHDYVANQHETQKSYTNVELIFLYLPDMLCSLLPVVQSGF